MQVQDRVEYPIKERVVENIKSAQVDKEKDIRDKYSIEKMCKKSIATVMSEKQNITVSIIEHEIV